ncbi:MAG: insulinase family protein [Alphaproteobacteria bacterium]|nr:insulinase family protein [Alphaproteobacteria bacterium]
MRKIIIKALFILGLMCYSQSAEAVLSDATEFYLKNGLHVVVVPNHKAPIIKQIVVYKAGRVDEPRGKGGIAHLLEHLMFRGTKKFKDGEFNRLIESNGGISNAATSHDKTYYHQFLSVDRLELAMYLEADRMANLSFDDETFVKEREVVFQERQERQSRNTTRDFWEKVDKIFWKDSLYGEPVGGTSVEIMEITKQDILDFYQNFYGPNNAILILSGDIDFETAYDLAQKYYGKLSAREIGQKGNTEDVDNREYRDGEYTVRTERNDINISRLSARYFLPHFKSDEGYLYAMMVFADYIGNSISSPLYKKLRLDTHLATAIGTDFDCFNRGNSTFSFYAYYNNPKDTQKIQNIFMQTLVESLNNMTEKDMELTKKRLLAGLVYHNDNPSDAADIVTDWLGAGYKLEDLKNYEQHINKVTLADVKALAATLNEYHPLWAVATPMQEAK